MWEIHDSPLRSAGAIQTITLSETQTPGLLTAPWTFANLGLHPLWVQQTDDVGSRFYLPDHPLPGSAQEQVELEELMALAESRHDDAALTQNKLFPFKPFPSNPWLTDISTWNELAHQVVGEMPQVLCRLPLHAVIRQTRWPVQLQARLVALFDWLTHQAALIAWHYQWESDRGTGVIQRPRPFELRPSLRPLATPCSPSYPSIYSVVAGATSTLLSHCLPQLQADLHNFADSIGMACLWAGVNYRSDHVNGLHLGQSIASLGIRHIAGYSKRRTHL